MTDKPTADKLLTCVARRHLNAAVFVTYDAMLAVATYWQNQREAKGEPRGALIFFGKATRLADMNDRNEQVERDNIKKLEALGWIVSTHEEQRRRRRAGTFTSNEWRVLTHDEFVAAHPDACPPRRYDDDGKPIKKGVKPRALHKASLRVQAARHKLIFADERAESRFLDLMLDHLPSVENPTLVTSVENPTQAESTSVEIPTTTSVGNPTTTAVEIPTTTTVGNPTTRSVLGCLENEARKNLKPASQNILENGEQAGRCLGEAEPFSSKSKGKTEAQRWIEFVTDKKADLPNTMKHAQPTDEERRKVLAQLDAIVLDDYAVKHGATKAEYLGMAISDWEETQSPPLSTLMYGRWKRWLETGDPNS
jgi:hypothetical protein